MANCNDNARRIQAFMDLATDDQYPEKARAHAFMKALALYSDCPIEQARLRRCYPELVAMAKKHTVVEREPVPESDSFMRQSMF